MKRIIFLLLAAFGLIACTSEKEPVDYVNPYMGNISHLLVPTYPTVQLPNSMLRVFPSRGDFTGDRLNGFPLMVTNHRRASGFLVSPRQGAETDMSPVVSHSYDREKILPYYYQVYLDDANIEVAFAPSVQSAVYSFRFENKAAPYLLFCSRNGEIESAGNTVSGYQQIAANTRLYVYAETDEVPVKNGILKEGKPDFAQSSMEGRNAAAVLSFREGTEQVRIRYGISLISVEQAKKNLNRDIQDYQLDEVARKGRDIWNRALSKIKVEGGTEDDKAVFYTSLYRCFERPVCISEDGRYFSAYDGKVHEDNGRPFYTDDWIWDTYRATHPLRIMIDGERQNDIIHSYLLMAEQKGTNWMPTFPEITGDAHCMNSNHGVSMVIDAYRKGLRGFELEKAYLACKAALETKSLIPWVEVPAGELDTFYREKGYFPALKPGEKETVANVHSWEKRQPIAVTLGTAYDQWCLSQIALELGREEEAAYYLQCSRNYRNVFNPETGFFHPKDGDGNFIPDLDYRYSGGLGARDYYDENNGYVYRWDVQHNIGDLVSLIGGNEKFTAALDRMFNEPLGKSKWEFYATLPDHTGNVGQFSMANEPSLHIPYLYNYAGQPWKTQKRIRTLLEQWFRNDPMGVPGDEDGGGMSAFVVFSQLGFYPVTPGSPTYNIGSPQFTEARMDLGNGKLLEIKARNASKENKYIQSARINGKPLDQAWFNHADIAQGGVLEFEMGSVANKSWGIASPPPSAD
ncbi:MAG: GH92 family glycosyl hydrolase [Tannerellaceae bacterium]|jgi:predicted alpha-1,2-mannosidase|nr:GH92 family glycosyl hydrolase [Tannerellaceae bacterium]